MRNRTLTYSAVGTLALGLSMAGAANAQGISIEAGDWDIGIDGNVNAFYIVQDPDSSPDGDVQGGLAQADAANGNDDHAIRTGLLPSKLGVAARTTQNDWDIEAYVSYWPGIQSGQGLNQNADNVNFRQVYFSVGNDDVGTFKAGRDLGIFSSQAILNDMTLLGVGTVGEPASGDGNTTLGRIGFGYIYADWKAQFSYQTPDINGFQATIGITEPWRPFTLFVDDDDGDPVDNSFDGDIVNEQPAIEGMATYAFDAGGVDTTVWGSFISQKVEDQDTDGGVVDYTARGVEFGASVSTGPFSGVVSFYDAKGLGTTAQFHQAVTQQGDERDSDGFYVQGMYTLPGAGTNLGLSYGESNLDDESGDAGDLLDKNSSVILGAYHPLTESITLTAEYTMSESENQDGDEIEEDSLALGGIMFF